MQFGEVLRFFFIYVFLVLVKHMLHRIIYNRNKKHYKISCIYTHSTNIFVTMCYIFRSLAKENCRLYYDVFDCVYIQPTVINKPTFLYFFFLQFVFK